MNSDYLLTSYDYDIHDDKIARYPLSKRSDSKLLHRQKGGQIDHRGFLDIENMLGPGDCIVLNESKVIPARLQGQKDTGGRVEVLMSRPVQEDPQEWICLVKPARRLKPGQRIDILTAEETSGVSATVVERLEREAGAFRLSFNQPPLEVSERFGSIPLPPYFKREAEDTDKQRYQTVFANDEKAGSAAAPTASLHFTETLLRRIQEKGVHIAKVTLHVGPGTFFPVMTEDIREHHIHAEPWSINKSSVQTINTARQNGGRIIPVGTTALRVIETAADATGIIHEGHGLTRLFIYPGYQWKITDALITNFHLPKSSLLMLVSALIGRENALAMYQNAMDNDYRFFSYGDSSFLERVD